MILLHDHGTKEGGYKDYSEQARNGIGIPMELPTWQQLTCKRQHKRKHHGNASRREDTVNQGIDSHLRQQLLPQTLFLCVGVVHAEMVERCDNLIWQVVLQMVIGRRRQTYHIRCEESGDHGYSHNHRIQEIANHTERKTQRGNDKRELTDLRHRETATHGRFKRLAAQHKGERAEDALSYQDSKH